MTNKIPAAFGADHFDKVASTYEPPRATNPMARVAQELILFAPEITSSSVIHDNAAGPGIITGEIMHLLEQKSSSAIPKFYASDVSPAMIEQLKLKGWTNVQAEVMDSQSLSYPDETFTHSFMSMGIFLLPDSEKGAKEIYRTLKPGGTAVANSIKNVGWIRIFQAAQKEVRPDLPPWQGPLPEEWKTKEKLRAVVEAGGFASEKIVIKETGAVMGSERIGGFMTEFMQERMTDLVVDGWKQEDVTKFKQCLQNELKKAVDEPYPLEVDAWVAIATK